ncbi:hypothetical protein CRG98_006556 [Punica granatum]|uniref:Reverse transcriptase domain-containing protein n=1 Tax=Punica granatum TaxID=22663 RepID=A0A2I0KX49_PUNGR|nr:hypothetical protein CRG98_006556 [Punica granatum]
MAEENVHQVSRGLTLEQAQFLGFQWKQDELSARLDQLTQLVEQLAVARAPPLRAHRVPRRNVQVENEADQEDELHEEEEQSVPRRDQRGVDNNLKLKIPQFKARVPLKSTLSGSSASIRCSNTMSTPKPRSIICQGGMSVEDYVMEFEMLLMRCELNEPWEQTIARFIGGLNKEITDVVELQPYVFLEDVIKLVNKVEKQRKCGKLNASRVFNSKLMVASSVNKGSTSKWNAQQTKNTQETESEDEGVDEEVSGGAQKENVEFADEGEMLMIRRVLSSQAKLEEEQRENLFRRCTIQNKVCGIIIDSGSCTNVASTTLVEKLNMATTKHPCLYKLRWLNDQGEVSLPPRFMALLKEFINVFPEELPEGLPPIKGIEHQIDLVPRAALLNQPAYRCNPGEAKELQWQVKELLEKGYVQESMSPYSVPALLVSKKDRSMRMCVNSRAINKITVKYRYPIPRPDDMLDELNGSKRGVKVDEEKVKAIREWPTPTTASEGYVRESMSPCFVPALLVPKKEGSMRMCVNSRAINKITVKYRYPFFD